jgi:hypothetical protein
VIDNAVTFRSKDQVLVDLAKALHFSPESLKVNREGRISSEQIKRLAFRCVRPAFLISIFLFVPLFIWIALTGAQQQASFLSAVPIFFNDLLHFGDSSEAHGRVGALVRLGSVLLSLGIAVLAAARFPFALYFDLLDGTVYIREGRVVAREEQTMRRNGRDPIEKYYFDMKTERYEVNLAAFRAIENGSVYLVYILPRSNVIVSLEPKMYPEPDAEENSTSAA